MKEKRYNLPKKIIRDRLKEAGTDADLIIAFLQGYGDALDERLEKKLSRLEFIADLIHLYGSKSKVVPMVVKKFSISAREAYREYEESLDVFGTTVKHSRELAIEHNLADLKSLYRICLQYKDFKTAAQVQKNITYIIERLMGDKEDGFDWSQVQPPQVYIAYMPETMNVVMGTEEELQKELRRFKAPAKKIIDISPISPEENGE